MDRMNIRSRLTELFKKYRYAVMIVLLGVVLMCLPSRRENTVEPVTESTKAEDVQTGLEESLSAILSQIKGAGKVEVLLTEAVGAETLYQSDSDTVTDSQRLDTVIISDGNRAQSGLIRQINPPSYQGAIVVCQGADSSAVKLAIVDAVSSVTGLGADRITVLKMK